jgi:hypothetical protein
MSHPCSVFHLPSVESKKSCSVKCCAASYSAACMIISILSKSLHSCASGLLARSYSHLQAAHLRQLQCHMHEPVECAAVPKHGTHNVRWILLNCAGSLG